MLGKLRLRQKDGFLIKERVDKQQQQKYVQVITHEYYKRPFPVNTGRKLNEHKSFRRRPGRLMYVQFMPCVHGFNSLYSLTPFLANISIFYPPENCIKPVFCCFQRVKK